MRVRGLAAAVMLWGSVLGAGVPEGAVLDRWVTELGSEDFSEREAAAAALREAAERAPRFLLLALAERYGKVRDLERRFRLEALLTPLAETYLFALPPGFIGINMEWWMEEGEAGIRVLSVLPDHAGARAGLKEGDVIVSTGGKTVAETGSLTGFTEWIAGHAPGTVLRVEFLRAGERKAVLFPLDARPEPLEGRTVEEVEARVRAWFRSLAGETDLEDPAFPVGHFPMDGE